MNKKIDKKIIIVILLVIISLIIGVCYFIKHENKEEIKEYNVTFNYNSNMNNKKVTIKEGDILEKPEDPLREDYIFIGWYNDEELYDFSLIVTSNLNLVAKWEKKEEDKYVITFDSDGGTTIKNQIVNKGEKVLIPDKPIKEGYEFISWQLNEEDYDFDNKINDNITLKAKWRKNKFVITFDSDGGTIIQNQEVLKDEKIVIPDNPTKEGYEFISWQLNGKDYDFNSEINDDIILKAKWEKIIAKYSSDLSGLYFTNLDKQIKPKKLIVILANYNNGYLSLKGDDAKVEKEWSDKIFGTGKISNQTASINDYFKEVSNNKFYYEPVLLGSNTTGVYSFHFDKDYTDRQGLHPEYSFFEFNYDIAGAVDELKKLGLDTSTYKAVGINNANYNSVLIDLYDANQSFRNKQWYDTNTILVVFPTVNTENVSFTPISRNINEFSLYPHINYNSTFGTIAHELMHTLGAIDTYNFGAYGGDLMSSIYPLCSGYYNIMHVNPYYKIIFGWANAKILLSDEEIVTMYPATSPLYNPIIVTTDDPNQYYIIENRNNDSFDLGILQDGSGGINIWRIDKLGMEAIYNKQRKGIDDYKLKINSVDLMYYQNFTDINDTTLVPSGISVEYIKSNSDRSTDILIKRK